MHGGDAANTVAKLVDIVGFDNHFNLIVTDLSHFGPFLMYFSSLCHPPTLFATGITLSHLGLPLRSRPSLASQYQGVPLLAEVGRLVVAVGRG